MPTANSIHGLSMLETQTHLKEEEEINKHQNSSHTRESTTKIQMKHEVKLHIMVAKYVLKAYTNIVALFTELQQ